MKCLEKKRRYRYYYFVTTCKDLNVRDIVIKEYYSDCAIFSFIESLRIKYDNNIAWGFNVQDFEEDLQGSEPLVLKSKSLISPILVFSLNNKNYFVTDIIELKYDTVTNGIAKYDRVFLPRKEDLI